MSGLTAGRLDRSKKRTTPSAAPTAMRGKDGSTATQVRAEADRMADWCTRTPSRRSHT